MTRNIFIPALEDQQRTELETVRSAEEFSFNRLLDQARREPKLTVGSVGSVDAIIAHWDFPTSVVVPILCKEYNLLAPPLESVLKCEHKYWSRGNKR